MDIKDKQKVKDRVFIQEIINDLYKNGFARGGKAEEMLKDWSRELRVETALQGRTKKTHAMLIGRHLY